MLKIKSHKIILLNSIFDGFIYISDGKIIEVSGIDKEADSFLDCSDYFVSPGFIEMHTHGGGGHPFIHTTVDDVIEACNFHLRHGTTSILPTITSAPFLDMAEATKVIFEAKKTNRSLANIIGVHLEGPYLSKEQSGAQHIDYITSPKKEQYEPLLKRYGDFIKKWTYAPENDKDYLFTKALKNNGTIASIGHSNAKYSDCLEAIKNGASMVTHLYSCCSTISREQGFRKLGVIESAYLMDELSVEIIADNKHIPPELLKLILKNKDHNKIVLVSDSLEIAGSNIKQGEMSGTKFIVEDGVCKLLDRSAFAGSIATDELLVKNVYEAGASITDAIKMMSYNPAKLLNLNKGEISKGKDADLVVFDEKFVIKQVIVNGKVIKI